MEPIQREYEHFRHEVIYWNAPLAEHIGIDCLFDTYNSGNITLNKEFKDWLKVRVDPLKAEITKVTPDNFHETLEDKAIPDFVENWKKAAKQGILYDFETNLKEELTSWLALPVFLPGIVGLYLKQEN